MPCNYIIKLETDTKYEHWFIPGCPSSNPSGAAVKYFQERTGSKISTLEQDLLNGICNRVWIVHQLGACIFEELYEVVVINNTIPENASLITYRDGQKLQIPTRIMSSRIVDSKPFKLIPIFSEYLADE